MQKLLIYFFGLIILVSCETETVEVVEPVEPLVRIYQAKNPDDITIPIRIEDYQNGTGVLLAELLFSFEPSTFDATFDYVTDERTNFSLEVRPSPNYTNTFLDGTGTFDQDSIWMTIHRSLGGMEWEDVYTGSR